MTNKTKLWHMILTAAVSCVLASLFLWSTGAENSPVIMVGMAVFLMMVSYVTRKLE